VWHGCQRAVHWAAFVVATAIGVYAGGAEICLRTECTSTHTVVRLGDVADVLASQPDQARSLAEVELFPLPPPGEQRFVRAREIQDMLWLRGVNIVEHQLSGASQTVVFGPQPVSGRIKVEAPVVREPTSPGVVVATRPLPAGTVLGAGDIRLEQGGSAAGLPAAPRAIDEVLGKETVKPIAAGKAIEASALRPAVVVRRGEVVTVCAHASGIRVETKAKAVKDGGLGDLIDLETLGDRRCYLARVVGPQRAVVVADAARTDQGWPGQAVGSGTTQAAKRERSR